MPIKISKRCCLNIDSPYNTPGKKKTLIKIYLITSTEIFKNFPCHQIIDLLKFKQNPWPWLNHMCSAVTFHNICPIIQLPRARIHQTCIQPKKEKEKICM